MEGEVGVGKTEQIRRFARENGYKTTSVTLHDKKLSRLIEEAYGYKRKWYHNTTLEKLEEWMVWIGVAALLGAIAFIVGNWI